MPEEPAEAEDGSRGGGGGKGSAATGHCAILVLYKYAQYANDLVEFIGPRVNAKVLIDPSAAAFKAEMIKRGIWHVEALEGSRSRTGCIPILREERGSLLEIGVQLAAGFETARIDFSPK